MAFLRRNPKNTPQSGGSIRPRIAYSELKKLANGLQVAFGPLYLTLGLIGLIGGSLFLIDGTRQSYVQYVQSKIWPAVEARVVRCSVVQVPILYHPGGSMRSPSRHGIKSYIGCRFAYQVGGRARETSAGPGSPIITDQQPLDLGTPKVTPAKLQGWVFRHRPGSTLTIHYTHPTRIISPWRGPITKSRTCRPMSGYCLAFSPRLPD